MPEDKYTPTTEDMQNAENALASAKEKEVSEGRERDLKKLETMGVDMALLDRCDLQIGNGRTEQAGGDSWTTIKGKVDGMEIEMKNSARTGFSVSVNGKRIEAEESAQMYQRLEEIAKFQTAEKNRAAGVEAQYARSDKDREDARTTEWLKSFLK